MPFPHEINARSSGSTVEVDRRSHYAVLSIHERMLEELNNKFNDLLCCLLRQGREIRGDIKCQTEIFQTSMKGIESRMHAIEMKLDSGVVLHGSNEKAHYTFVHDDDKTDPKVAGITDGELMQLHRECAVSAENAGNEAREALYREIMESWQVTWFHLMFRLLRGGKRVMNLRLMPTLDWSNRIENAQCSMKRLRFC